MNSLIKSSTGEILSFGSASLSADLNSWLWTFDADIADSITLNKLKPVKSLTGDYVAVQFTLGTTDFHLIIEEASSNISANSHSVSGRSKTVLLAEPYAPQITQTWLNSTALTIAQELCDSAGITLDWDISDWDVAIYTAQDRYPIDIINELAEDMGAKVQSTASGALKLIPYPPCSPTALDQQAYTQHLSTTTNVFEVSRKFVNRDNFNHVLISAQSPITNDTQPSISIEETKDGNLRVIDVITTPLNPDVELVHSSAANVHVWYQGSHTHSVTDTLTIIDGNAQLSKPPHSITAVTWQQQDGGQLAIDAYGKVTANIDFGLVTVTYNYVSHRYTISQLADIDQTALKASTPDNTTAINAIVCDLIIGNGDKTAPPIIVKTLSTLELLKQRGEAYLWQHLYDAEQYNLECDYPNVPTTPATICRVDIQPEALSFNGIVQSVHIQIDDTITQNLTIERPLL